MLKLIINILPQIIGYGDFKQLPPVPNSLHLDPGDYCFLAPEFDVFPKGQRIILTEVRRLVKNNDLKKED